MGMLQDIWNYRGFILGSVKREFQLKYRNSLLGAAWTVLNPLAMILVYTVIFSQVMHNRLPGNPNQYSFSIYLCSGLLTWSFFSEIVGRSQTVFLEHANLIKKINFPNTKLILAKDMGEAVNIAKEKSAGGGVVLLSTACASFGLFKNYKERGDLFKKYVGLIK